MIAAIVFWVGAAVALYVGWLYFRDLGDVVQMFLKVKRENTIRFIRNEYRLVGLGLAGFATAAAAHLLFGAANPMVFWILTALVLLFYAFPFIWVHVGLRNQLTTAKFFPIDVAKGYVSPSNSVLVMEKDGVARAYPDHELLRPHLAGDAEGLNGENVAMTYCAMANCGIGYKPEIDGRPLNLDVLAQHGNNLILRDNETGEPIQQIIGRTNDGQGPALESWPTFRMSFRGFQRAYPEGTVFINMPSRNPFLWLFDQIAGVAFGYGIGRQHREEAPIMDNMTRYDERLPNKTYVWGVNIGDDAVAFTDDFIFRNGNIVNTQVGGRGIVLAYDPEHESLGAWYNDTGQPVTRLDFFGNTDNGSLQRVETMKPGMFWHVWAEFFPHTDINRIGNAESHQAESADA